MNHFEELIKQNCPQGVEFKHLWEVTAWDKNFKGIEKEKQIKILSFKHVSASKLKTLDSSEGDIKLLSTGKFDGWTNKILAEDNVNDGEVITIPSGGSANIKYYHGRFVDSGNLLASSIDNSILNLKYCFYFLLEKNYLIESYFRGSGVKHPDMRKLLHLKIPVPSITIQKKIVDYLDTFTELDSNLKEELKIRKRQYVHYKNKLLTFQEDIILKTLDEVCLSVSAGGDVPKKYKKGQKTPSKEFPFPIFANAVGIKGLYGFSDGYRIEHEAVTIAARGAKIGYHTIRKPKFTPIIRLITLVPNKDIIMTSFLNYILDMTAISGTDGGIPQLTVPTVKKIKIPVPSLEEQEKIVDILNKFDALINDISEGIPAEITLRRKQYKYYREKILTFEEKVMVA